MASVVSCPPTKREGHETRAPARNPENEPNLISPSETGEETQTHPQHWKREGREEGVRSWSKTTRPPCSPPDKAQSNMTDRVKGQQGVVGKGVWRAELGVSGQGEEGEENVRVEVEQNPPKAALQSLSTPNHSAKCPPVQMKCDLFTREEEKSGNLGQGC